MEIWLLPKEEIFPCEQYEELNEAIKEMDNPFRSPDQFMRSQIADALSKYEEQKKNKKYC